MRGTHAATDRTTALGCLRRPLIKLSTAGFLAALLVALAALAFLASAPATAQDPACPNAEFRTGPSANLPDCRAYEMVSPLDKGGFGVTQSDGGAFLAGSHKAETFVLPTGDGITYVAGGAFADPASSTGSGQPYLSTRGTDTWSTLSIAPPLAPPIPPALGVARSWAISDTGSMSVVETPAGLVSDAPECTSPLGCPQRLYLQDNRTREHQLITPAPVSGPGTPPGSSIGTFADGTPDLDHVLFTADGVLLSEAPEGVTNLYEWIDDGTQTGNLKLVGIAPDGTPLEAGSVAGQVSGTGVQETRRSISDDAKRIFFASGDQLYVREEGSATVHVSASQRTTPDPAGPLPATFWTAEVEHGSAVYFTSGEKLTDDSNASSSQPDLYRYDVDTGELTDLTADPDGPADVRGVIGASEDASRLYFAAGAQLIDGQGTAGQPNVFLWRDDGTADGELSFVTTAADAARNWFTGSEILPEQVSSSGRYVALLSNAPLTGDDTAGRVQAYVFDAQSGEIECASCNPTGQASTADTSFRLEDRVVRVVSESGQVAFQTTESLDPADTNGQRDVYLYADGVPHLVSTGKSNEPSTYMGMGPSGENMFFATQQQLVGQDADELIDLYSARVNGGFPEPTPPPSCEGEDCKGPPFPGPGDSPPGSSSLVGPGNPELDPAGARGCNKLDKRANKVKRKSRRAKRQAKRASGSKAKRLRKKSKRLKRKSKRLKREAMECERNRK